MTRFGWFECLILVAFFFSAMAAFLIGGMKLVGHVAQVFFWTSVLWLALVPGKEFWIEMKKDWERTKREWQWRKLKRMKGME